MPGNMVLDAPEGHGRDKVQLYESETGGTALVLPKEYPANQTRDVWIQGTAHSGEQRDVWVTLSYSRDDSTYTDTAKFTVVGVDISHCPDLFVPGHDNIVSYLVSPDDYTAAYGTFEIFRRDDNGLPAGAAVYSYSGPALDKSGGTVHEFIYSGTGINYGQERYLVKISAGQTEGNAASDSGPFDVKAWCMTGIFWDCLTEAEKAAIDAVASQAPPDYRSYFDPLAVPGDPTPMTYCAGVNAATVNASKVSVKLWYWDQTEEQAATLNISDGVPSKTLSDPDWQNIWGRELGEKPWYDERGSALTDLNGDFYSMSEGEQYFWLVVTVAADGVLDNVANCFDAEPDTGARQGTLKYKLRIDAGGNITVLEESAE
jgi:hypothetical protein